MKTENIFIQGLNEEVTFYIGKNKNDNFDVIDKGESDDLWFHANELSSCHVVAILPKGLSKKDIKYIIKMGALLCKQNTNKIKDHESTEIIYTQIKYIEKTSIPGLVKIMNKKCIKI
jgi:predicted ribosome quality control (RQC) complex YloA/Tae2 family protein